MSESDAGPIHAAQPAPRRSVTAPDLKFLRDAVRLRDRCRRAAMEQHERAGLTPSFVYANATYDAIVELIREDERSRPTGEAEATS